MENTKQTAVYARTSSYKQNVEIQLESAYPYLEGVYPENVSHFIDQGISGSSQPSLEKLIDQIKENQIDTLIVYDRSRLTRSMDTYLELINLVNRHQVNVIFTAPGHSSLNKDITAEGLFALMSNIERIMMSNRIKDSKKRKQI